MNFDFIYAVSLCAECFTFIKRIVRVSEWKLVGDALDYIVSQSITEFYRFILHLIYNASIQATYIYIYLSICLSSASQ